MSFRPPFCPHPDCAAHTGGPFPWRRRGSFRRQLDGRTVPRFSCLTCGRSFSSQTFRLDYRLRRPELTLRCFQALVSKVTLRQCARVLGCRRRTVEHRLRLLGKHCRAFHRAQLARARGRRGAVGGDFQLDELETFEHHRKLAPLTVPVLVSRRTLFVVEAAVAPMACRGRLSERDRLQKRSRELLTGKRRSGSRAAVETCLRSLVDSFGGGASIQLETDHKASYCGCIRRVLGPDARHVQRDAARRRDRRNPLFPINHTLASMRDGISRLVRRTWAASKRAAMLQEHVWIWIAWRNYVRPITNRAPSVTAAMAAGVCARMTSMRELLRRRLDYES